MNSVLEQELSDLEIMIELAEEMEDYSVVEEIQEAYKKYTETAQDLRRRRF